MATTVTSIHRANDRDGSNVSFQIDHTIGENHALLTVIHTSPGRVKTVELDIPLSEFSELIRSLTLVLEEAPLPEKWCGMCMGSGEIPLSPELPTDMVPCPSCDGRGLAR